MSGGRGKGRDFTPGGRPPAGVIDLDRVRRGLAMLDETARRFPHLREPEAAARCADWIAGGGPDSQGLEVGVSALETTLQIRVSADTAARADALIGPLASTAAGVAAGRVTRSMVLRLALAEGLAVLEQRHVRTEGAKPSE